MKKYIATVMAVALALLGACAKQEAAEERAYINTNLGTMVVQFDEAAAPKTVANFKAYARKGWYNGKTFYRVVKDFVIQAGDNNDDSTEPTIEGEFNAKHLKGTISLARSEDPNSGSTEFFICLSDLARLDGKYAAFGQVVEGIEVVDAIGNVEVEEKFIDYDGKQIAFHTPAQPVVIESIEIR